jgi:ABC-type bacteriocin/lantibiotic exporter with double-glycine peptidase domain
MWHINAAGSPVINNIGKLITAATLWYDAHMVVDQQLSVGQLVAFNMFAQLWSLPLFTGLFGDTGSPSDE